MKNIPQYPKYSISENGEEIKNNETGKLLKQSNTKYIYVTLLLNDKKYQLKRIAVHRLVAFTYLSAPNSDKHIWVNHKDGNKHNNHFSAMDELQACKRSAFPDTGPYTQKCYKSRNMSFHDTGPYTLRSKKRAILLRSLQTCNRFDSCTHFWHTPHIVQRSYML